MNVGGVPWTGQKDPTLKDGFCNAMILCCNSVLQRSCKNTMAPRYHMSSLGISAMAGNYSQRAFFLIISFKVDCPLVQNLSSQNPDESCVYMKGKGSRVVFILFYMSTTSFSLGLI